MKLKLHVLAGMVMVSAFAKAQLSFSDATAQLQNPTLKSGVAMGVTDMNNDGLDDIIRLDNATNLEIEFQQPDGSFSRTDVGPVANPWAMIMADVDRNGRNDIIVGGAYDGLRYINGNTDGTYAGVALNGPDIFLQNANFADIDNDGNIDFFGCHDDGISSAYRNDGDGALGYDENLIDTSSTVASDNSGNYGSIWTDYDNDGDLDLYISKCRQGVDDPMDGRRLNLLFQNDGNGNYTDVAEAAGLRPMTQTWSANFEDIDNDGDMDAVIVNHFSPHQIFENNGDGTFTDITADTGIVSDLEQVGFGIQVMMEDFDNDAYVDIFMTTTNGVHHLFLNNGDKTFTTASNPFPTNNEIVQSAAVGDLNNDGFMDIIAGYATGFNSPNDTVSDQLFLNDGNDNNWIKMILTGVESNENGIGARIELITSEGTQIREVRAGESYGTQNSLTTHFGIADLDAIDRIIIRWPSGIVDTILDPEINSTLELLEGENVLGLEDQSYLSNFTIYPNPAVSQLSVKFSNISNISSATVYDLNGKKILSKNIQQIDSTIDVSQLPSGLYFIEVEGQTSKFIKK